VALSAHAILLPSISTTRFVRDPYGAGSRTSAGMSGNGSEGQKCHFACGSAEPKPMEEAGWPLENPTFKTSLPRHGLEAGDLLQARHSMVCLRGVRRLPRDLEATLARGGGTSEGKSCRTWQRQPPPSNGRAEAAQEREKAKVVNLARSWKYSGVERMVS